MKKLTRSVMVLISLLATYACKEEQKEIVETKQPEQKQEQTSTNKQATADSIVYDFFQYPTDTTYIAKILVPGIFHEDEVSKGADQLKWFGLFYKDSTYHLSETRIQTPRVFDEILDEFEDEKTGWEVKALHPDSALLMISELDFLKNKPVTPAQFAESSFLPGDTVQFNYLGLDYRLYATGNKRKESNGTYEWYQIWNFRLYVAAKINGKWVEDLLMASPSFDDAMIGIMFAGDLDGDERLDLLINTSNHYNASCPTLYLSKPAEKGRIIKVVGMHCSVGC